MKNILFVACAIFLFGCGSDNNGTNNGSNNGGDTTQTTQTTPSEVLGTTLLVDKMEFTKQPEAKLNGIVKDNLDQEMLEFPIVILLDFMNIDLSAKTLTLRGGAGLKTDTAGEYIWDPSGDTSTDRGVGTINDKGEFSATIELFEFIATSVFENDEISKTPIPIRDLKISGVVELTEDNLPIKTTDAKIEGYITFEDGENTRLAISAGTAGVPLTTLFQKQNLNFITATKKIVDKGDPDADAWYLNGTISAKSTIVK